jgi:hypothetical protein
MLEEIIINDLFNDSDELETTIIRPRIFGETHKINLQMVSSKNREFLKPKNALVTKVFDGDYYESRATETENSIILWFRNLSPDVYFTLQSGDFQQEKAKFDGAISTINPSYNLDTTKATIHGFTNNFLRFKIYAKSSLNLNIDFGFFSVTEADNYHMPTNGGTININHGLSLKTDEQERRIDSYELKYIFSLENFPYINNYENTQTSLSITYADQTNYEKKITDIGNRVTNETYSRYSADNTLNTLITNLNTSLSSIESRVKQIAMNYATNTSVSVVETNLKTSMSSLEDKVKQIAMNYATNTSVSVVETNLKTSMSSLENSIWDIKLNYTKYSTVSSTIKDVVLLKFDFQNFKTKMETHKHSEYSKIGHTHN